MKTKALILIGILIIASSAAMIAPVMALTSTTITGNPPAEITVTVTGNIVNWNLDPSLPQPIENTSFVTLSVTTNYRAWTVTPSDGLDNSKPGPSKGYMAEFNGAPNYVNPGIDLGNPMSVSVEKVTPGYTNATTTMTGSPSAIATGDGSIHAAGVFSNKNLIFNQESDYTDPVLTGGEYYQIIVTFTGATP